MIDGETRIVRHTETGDSAFAFDETPTLTVTYADGTTVAPAVTVSPGSSDDVQTLSAVVALRAGIDRLEWRMDKGDEDPIIRIETYFVTWSDVHGFIRELLNTTVDDLPDSRIDRELARITRQLASLCTSVGAYHALTGDDRYAFDDMLAYGAAYALYNRPSSSSVAGSGAIKRMVSGEQTIEYDVGTTTTRAGNAANLLAEYNRALGAICPDALIDPSRRARSSTPVSTLPNSFDPRDSLYTSDVERAAEAEVG